MSISSTTGCCACTFLLLDKTETFFSQLFCLNQDSFLMITSEGMLWLRCCKFDFNLVVECVFKICCSLRLGGVQT